VKISSDTDSAIAGCAIMRANWPPPTMPMRALGWLMFLSLAYPALVLDAVTAEVVRNALSVAAQEAGVVVVKASHSTFIQESADASTAVLDAQGRLIASSTATTLMHSASLRESLRALMIDVPLATMRQGDVFAQNDPFKGGIHANDIAVMRPCSPRTEAVRTISPGPSSTSPISVVAMPAVLPRPRRTCFAEGVIIPPLRLYNAGEPEPVLWTILENNSRTSGKGAR
jgi:N-methylhydantoinase B